MHIARKYTLLIKKSNVYFCYIQLLLKRIYNLLKKRNALEKYKQMFYNYITLS